MLLWVKLWIFWEEDKITHITTFTSYFDHRQYLSYWTKCYNGGLAESIWTTFSVTLCTWGIHRTQFSKLHFVILLVVVVVHALWDRPSISPLSHTESLTLLGWQVLILVCFIHPTAPTTDTQMPGRLQKIPVVSGFAATRSLADKCTMHSSPWRGLEILPASRR